MLILFNLSVSKSFIAKFLSRNKALWVVVFGATAMLFFIILSPFFRDLFHFSLVSFHDIAIAIVAGIVSVAWFEILK